MKTYKIILIFTVILILSGCRYNWIEKPKELIPPQKMVDMLVDLHIANAIFLETNYRPGTGIKLKSEDYYYSVLHKYNIPDSVFEKSVIYYSNYPKEFEKIYADVLDKINIKKEEVAPQANKPVNIKNE